MDHVKQNDSGIYLPIQQIGCFFRSAGLLAEYLATENNLDHQKLTISQINRGWEVSKMFTWIDRNNDVRESAKIATYFYRMLGGKGRITEVATFRGGVLQFYDWTKNLPEYQETLPFLIQKIKQNGPNKYHFRLVAKDGTLIEDPHKPDIKCQEVLYSILYHWDPKDARY